MFLAVNSKIALADIFALTMKYLLTSYQYHYNSEKENKSCWKVNNNKNTGLNNAR